MSEHAAFCTEYVQCNCCFEGAKSVLLARRKFLCSTVIPGFPIDTVNSEGDPMEKECPVPIIAGKIGSNGFGGEYFEMLELIQDLEPQLCHPMRISLMSEDGSSHLFVIQPKKKLN